MILIMFLENLVEMFMSMSFYIMLGLLFVGILHIYVKKDSVLKHLGTESFASVVKASVVGVPLPLCSCGVVPTAVELKKDGASNGAVVSFLISTPQTGVDSILATYSMMGLLMAVYRPIAAFLSGIISGGIVELFAKKEVIHTDLHTHCGCGCEATHHNEVEEHCHCGCETEVVSSCGCGCEETQHQETISSCGCGCGCESGAVPTDTIGRLKGVFFYAYGDFLDEIAGHFVIGMILAALIATFVPSDFFVNLGLDHGILAMLAMIVIGLPMYICSTASIPIAISLVGKGLSFGAAFAFLFSGPVTNIASILVLSKALGKKITSLYIGCVVAFSVVFGLLLDVWIAHFGVTSLGFVAGGVHAEHTGILTYAVAVIFLLLLIKSFVKHLMARKGN